MDLSVVICTYNYARFLKDALRTLAAQTISDFELVIVDDGSVDDTAEVVEQFSGQFRQCRYLIKPHTGLPDSLNFGIRASTGTHIAFLDADDLWSLDYLRSVRGVFESEPEAELVCCEGFWVTSSGIVLRSSYPPGLPPLIGKLHNARELFQFFRYSAPSGTVYVRSLYDRVGPYDTRFPIGHDQHWIIRAVTQGAFCVRLDRQLVLFRRHGSNITSATLEDQVFGMWISIYEDVLRGNSFDPAMDTYARAITRRWLLGMLSRYAGKRGRRLLAQAIEAHRGDWLLQVAYFLSYFGLCGLARWGRRAKHLLLPIAPQGRTFDLNAAPEVMFATVPVEPQRPSGMTAGKST